MSYYDNDDRYLQHGNFKYLNKFWKNGHWNYVYKKTGTNLRGWATLAKQGMQKKAEDAHKAYRNSVNAVNGYINKTKQRNNEAGVRTGSSRNGGTNLRGRMVLAKQSYRRKKNAVNSYINKTKQRNNEAAIRTGSSRNGGTNLRGYATLAKQSYRRKKNAINSYINKTKQRNNEAGVRTGSSRNGGTNLRGYATLASQKTNNVKRNAVNSYNSYNNKRKQRNNEAAVRTGSVYNNYGGTNAKGKETLAKQKAFNKAKKKRMQQKAAEYRNRYGR